MKLENEILVGYIDTLYKTRRAIKGIKLHYLPLANLVLQVEPVRAHKLAKIYNCSRSAINNRLKRAISHGVIEKKGLDYSVTPYGKMISEELSKNFAPHLARIKAQLLAELREQL